jgi:hypothetical protein
MKAPKSLVLGWDMMLESQPFERVERNFIFRHRERARADLELNLSIVLTGRLARSRRRLMEG